MSRSVRLNNRIQRTFFEKFISGVVRQNVAYSPPVQNLFRKGSGFPLIFDVDKVDRTRLGLTFAIGMKALAERIWSKSDKWQLQGDCGAGVEVSSLCNELGVFHPSAHIAQLPNEEAGLDAGYQAQNPGKKYSAIAREPVPREWFWVVCILYLGGLGVGWLIGWAVTR